MMKRILSTLLLCATAINSTAVVKDQSTYITFDNKGRFGSVTLAVVTGDKNSTADITKQTDAHIIVNAANATLLGGSGVDGAVHKAAGHQLREYIKTTYKEIVPGVRCETGDMQETPAFDLENNNVHFILHAVAPDCRKKEHYNNREKLLQSCYEHCFWRALWLADSYSIETLAFPSLSTGIYEYPLEQAAPLAINTIASLIDAQDNSFNLREIRFVVWPENFAAYSNALTEYAHQHAMKLSHSQG